MADYPNLEKTIHGIVAGEKCTACCACELVCPTHCISMALDEEGFTIPRIDYASCIACGVCRAHCHMANSVPLATPEQGYIAIANDGALRASSTSGGVFALLGLKAIEAGASVFGAAFDKELHVAHIAISDARELHRLQGSKYVQSDMRGVYNSVSHELKIGRKVLFSGTPCQVAGLRAFLKGDHANLTTVDVICHGVPSPRLWEWYVRQRVGDDISDRMVSAAFRLKEFNDKYGYILKLEVDGSITKTPGDLDLYYALFLNGLSLRECCYDCPYAQLSRCSDITVGDCGSFYKYSDFFPYEVTSAVLVNTDKGMQAISELESALSKAELDIREEVRSNAQLRNPTLRPPARDIIYKDLATGIFNDLEERYTAQYSMGERVKNLIKRATPWRLRARVKSFVGAKWR